MFAELPAAPVQVMDTRFDANCAVIEGGGIAISRSEMVVARSNFTTNAAGSLHCPRIASQLACSRQAPEALCPLPDNTPCCLSPTCMWLETWLAGTVVALQRLVVPSPCRGRCCP